MRLQVILNALERHGSFVYESAAWADSSKEGLLVRVRPRRRSRPICSGCGNRGGTYDHLPERRFQHVPLWGLAVWFVYAARRVACPACGVKVERIPWASGKERTTSSFQWFLARWAKRLSWRETAEIFGTSWHTVFRAVKMAVCWGIRHRELEGIEAIGIDEVAYRKGHQYFTLVYQIDRGSRRLLWVGQDRTKETLGRFFRFFGRRRTERLKYICSDMWKAYLSVIAREANGALHILDRFHIMQLFNKAIDKVRAQEARELKRKGFEVLKRTRWLLLKRRGNLKRKEVLRLNELLTHNLRTVKCYLMKEDFQRLWDYKAPWRIGSFFQEWLDRALSTRIEPMRNLARTLERHAEQIFNWFEAKGEISAGAVEGMNLKVKLTTRRSYGFRDPNTLKYALYHNLGNLPEPPSTHKF
ncbi:Transposase [Planctomycetes bacterium Pan216]|uniref:Transposase n=1 Tax=Kolteria novifilia TaxID=2527975 RepID=A0A518B9P0_9BACT|nr:Transposase [Planctomycetes bacterium Pan216]